MFLHFQTAVRAPAVRASLRPAFEAFYAEQRERYPNRSMYDLTQWPLRRHMTGHRTDEEKLGGLVDKLSTPLFTIRIPDVGFSWRDTADERNAWIREEWELLALPGQPPAEMLQRQHWNRVHVQGFLVYTGLDQRAHPIYGLTPRGYGFPAHIGHLRVMLRKNFT